MSRLPRLIAAVLTVSLTGCASIPVSLTPAWRGPGADKALLAQPVPLPASAGFRDTPMRTFDGFALPGADKSALVAPKTFRARP
jgi:hypothetical protein